jgi:hypothetical protein
MTLTGQRNRDSMDSSKGVREMSRFAALDPNPCEG